MRSTVVGTIARLYEGFRSARTTVIIITVLLLLFFSGLVIPQKTFFPSGEQYEAWKVRYAVLSRVVETLQLNEVYVAPITVFFFGLFFANLAVVLGHRVPVVLRKAYLGRRNAPRIDIAAVKSDPETKVIEIPGGFRGNAVHEVLSFLKKRLWFPVGRPSGGAVLALRNRYSPLGFLLFHASFVLCLVGGLFVMYTRFSGYLVLTEGQEFNADITQFSRITRDPKIFKALPPIGIRLQKVMPRYEANIPTSLEVRMSVLFWNKIDDVVVRVNEPVKRGAVSVLAENIGVSPLFVLRSAGGKIVDAGYVSLNVLDGKEDSFQFQGAPYEFFVRFYPDHVVEDGTERSRSRELKNPAARIKAVQGPRTVFDRTLRVGEAAVFDGLRLSFEDVRYWVKFLIVREYGNVPLFLGFLLGAAGLVMRLIFYQKTLRVVVEGGDGANSRIYLLGRSEHNRYSFADELDRLTQRLEAELLDAKAREASSAGLARQAQDRSKER